MVSDSQFSANQSSVIEEITKWTLPQDGDSYVRLGHIHGPGITEKSSSEQSVPFEIYKSMAYSCLDTLVLHITSQQKSSEITDEHNNESFQAAFYDGDSTYDLATESYGTMLTMLRANSIPPPLLGREGWKDSILPSKVLFIVDVDADVSAEFALLLVALLTWATETSIQQKKATLRVLTMSSEPMSDLVGSFFKIYRRAPMADFEIILYASVASAITVGEEEILPVVVDRISMADPEHSHTVVSFRELKQIGFPPEDWSIDKIQSDSTGRDLCVNTDGEKRLVITKSHFRIPEQVFDSDCFHIVTNDTRTRKVFDRKMAQTVRLNLRTSASERKEQISWVDRNDFLGASAIVYQHVDFLDGANAERPRRMDVTGPQLSGFLAGLAEFSDWPIQGERVIAALKELDPVPVEETKRRLIQQDLVTFGPNGNPILGMRLPTHELFFKVLPLVGYDARIAMFLSQTSSFPNVTLVKIQLAALLTVGVDTMMSLDTSYVTREEVLEAANIGLAGPKAGHGKLWLVLGYVKGLLLQRELEPDLNFFQVEAHVVLEGAVQICSRGCRRVLHLIEELGDAFQAVDIEVPSRRVSDETGVLNDLEYNEILWDLLHAFVHQLGIATDVGDGPWPIYDLVSKQPIEWSDEAMWPLDWDFFRNADRPQKEQEGVTMGFYTQLERASAGSSTVALDWNWIPLPLIWRWHREIVGLDKMIGPLREGSNEDELQEYKFGL
ncbi:hypothetical protein EDB80DRAFT_896980 [Ilyonectria destructans]|nr:hypothetical protein EDB80DRAFT_896980 [Ilyonectria destructans]